MATDPSGEIPTDEDFCARMVDAREKKGWTQKQLGARIGTSQVTISSIEAGGASAFIPAVCRLLKIPGPMYGWSELQRQWAIIGHKLEERSPATFKLAMTMIQQMLDELQAADVPTERPPTPPLAPKKKPAPVGRANIAGHDREHARRLRGADELPGESKSKR